MPPTAITYLHAADGCRSIGGRGWMTADAGAATPPLKGSHSTNSAPRRKDMTTARFAPQRGAACRCRLYVWPDGIPWL